ncbi:dNA gyrase subunit A [Clostridium sp. CAG:609]|nr:dNA gyrase subunit A [Clostridium sp. CAG:609]
MDHSRDRLQENNIVNEIESSFIEYSMSVIISRALPDLRDGLKPVHRRIIYDMLENGLTPDKKHRKSATIVGDVMGKYHPHGDSSIYDAMVRMAQDFNYRYLLVDGHGNFGNIEYPRAAAYRYTESKLAKISMELLRDINKNTVNFVPNYDESTKEPEVLPSRFPNILVNGTMGIAVGMATNIPPHNLGEVIDGCIAYIDNPDITTEELMQHIKGPDFPTGGIILGNSGIKKAYETGRGSITIRSKATIEEKNGRHYIVIEEVPYGVNTLDLKQKVADLVHNKVLEGITDYHTDLKDGIKITITLKKDANPQVVLNNLYKHTAFQTTFGIIFLMLDKGVPRTLGLKDIISKYVDYQQEVIIRRTQFELDKAEKRVHILEGYQIVFDNLDEVIKIIKESKADGEAKLKLMERFGLTEAQTDNILEMKLRRLTGLEREKIEEELNALRIEIERLRGILADNNKVLGIIKDEMTEIKNKYGDERRTKIDMTAIDYIEDESLIPEENILVVLTNKGYIKRTTSDTFKSQNRGGVGIKGMSTNDEDFVEHMINLSTHDYILFFTDKGKVYRLKGYEIPEFSRQSKGIPIVNLLQIEKDERVNAVIQITREENSKYLLFATEGGVVKKTLISEFDNIRNSGKICISLRENDKLIDVKKTTGSDLVLLGSDAGRMVKFNEDEIRVMGRTASGVRGITLDGGKCICSEIVSEDDTILLVTEKGYGKQTKVSEYRQTKRGSKGVKAMNITEKNGNLVSVKIVHEGKELVIMTNSGMTMRMPLDQISVLGRVTQGLRLINLKDNQKVSTISLVDKEEETVVEESTQEGVSDMVQERVEQPIENNEEA